METVYKVKVTETVTRTIELEVRAGSAEEADEMGVREARDTKPADWNYTWDPITSSSEIVPSN